MITLYVIVSFISMKTVGCRRQQIFCPILQINSIKILIEIGSFLC